MENYKYSADFGKIIVICRNTSHARAADLEQNVKYNEPVAMKQTNRTIGFPEKIVLTNRVKFRISFQQIQLVF